jgi:hypothetical protein
MVTKLAYLQLIYGVAGAREKFEDLAVHPIRSERPDAERVRIVRGDGGIDAHEGSLADPTGVDIFQVKFFTDGIGESQKAQIRESFNTVKGGTVFKARSWTLCLPIDMSVEEKRWFDDWSGRRQATGIEIRPMWGATKLEGLLYEPKNRGVKEGFFKEEHLAQIREMHDMLTRLLDEIRERLPGPVPLVLRPYLLEVRPRRCYDYDDDFIMVEVQFCFEVENVGTQSVTNWSVQCEVKATAEGWLTRQTFPKISTGPSYYRPNATILPTLSLTTEITFGLKVRRVDSLEVQVRQLSKGRSHVLGRFRQPRRREGHSSVTRQGRMAPADRGDEGIVAEGNRAGGPVEAKESQAMTERQWDTCTDPAAMLRLLRDRRLLTERKARLFGAACCRRLWALR